MVTLGVQVINVQLFTDCLHNCLYPALYTNPYINIYICTYICNIHIYIHIFKYLSYSQWSFITITSLENPKPNSNFFVLSFVYTAGFFFSVNDLQIEIKKLEKFLCYQFRVQYSATLVDQHSFFLLHDHRNIVKQIKQNKK